MLAKIIEFPPTIKFGFCVSTPFIVVNIWSLLCLWDLITRLLISLEYKTELNEQSKSAKNVASGITNNNKNDWKDKGSLIYYFCVIFDALFGSVLRFALR